MTLTLDPVVKKPSQNLNKFLGLIHIFRRGGGSRPSGPPPPKSSLQSSEIACCINSIGHNAVAICATLFCYQEPMTSCLLYMYKMTDLLLLIWVHQYITFISFFFHTKFWWQSHSKYNVIEEMLSAPSQVVNIFTLKVKQCWSNTHHCKYSILLGCM